MKEDGFGIFRCFILVCAFCAWGAIIAPITVMANNEKIEELKSKAVEVGVATWSVDKKTGDTKFEWNKVKETSDESNN